MITLISLCFLAGLALSAMSGTAMLLEAAFRGLRFAVTSTAELLARSLNRAAAAGQAIGQPRARSV